MILIAKKKKKEEKEEEEENEERTNKPRNSTPEKNSKILKKIGVIKLLELMIPSKPVPVNDLKNKVTEETVLVVTMEIEVLSSQVDGVAVAEIEFYKRHGSVNGAAIKEECDLLQECV